MIVRATLILNPVAWRPTEIWREISNTRGFGFMFDSLVSKNISRKIFRIQLNEFVSVVVCIKIALSN